MKKFRDKTVLKGLLAEIETRTRRLCHPDAPHGPCMVSFEGACLAYFKYGRLSKGQI